MASGLNVRMTVAEKSLFTVLMSLGALKPCLVSLRMNSIPICICMYTDLKIRLF